MAVVATFITVMHPEGEGPSLAVKDIIDVEGIPTTAGSKAVEATADPAPLDAILMAGARKAGARVVGKTNLYELAFGASGVNEFFGTPCNPLNRLLLPGGSSSGSAVAVADGEAEVAYGSDTGGSVRVPAAFCGIAGLKTTHGRIPLTGVYPLAPSLDTVGPMASNVAGLILGMQLLEPGFAPIASASSIALIRDTGIPIDPQIQDGVDKICALAELTLSQISLEHWPVAFDAGSTILHVEAVKSNRNLIEMPTRYAMLSAAVRERLEVGKKITHEQYQAAVVYRSAWQKELDEIFTRVQILALPTVGFFPPPLGEAFDHTYTHLTMPFNLSGYPAVSLPLPVGGPLPASLQLLGPHGSEELLLGTAARFEQVVLAKNS